MPEQKPEKENLEFLKRGDIKTMQKDVARLREEEAGREKERVIKLKTEEEAKKEQERLKKLREEAEARQKIEEDIQRREVEKQKLTATKTAEPEKEGAAVFPPVRPPIGTPRPERGSPHPGAARRIIPPFAKTPEAAPRLPKRPRLFDKIFIRAALCLIFILIIVFAGTFGYWYFIARQAGESGLLPTPTSQKPSVLETPEGILPDKQIFKKIEVLKVGNADEITSALNQLLRQNLEIGSPAIASTSLAQALRAGGFARVLALNTAENRYLSPKEVFEALGVKIPEDIYQKTRNMTLFVYSQKEGKRFGFAAELLPPSTREELIPRLKVWEGTMENDFAPIFTLMGKTNPALSPFFKDSSYREIPVRFQTFTLQDMGILYSARNSFLIWSSSFESIKKIIDIL